MIMKELQSRIPEPTHYRRKVEFPVTLEGKMEAILSSLNSAPKAAVLLLLSESLIDTASLNRAYRDTASGSQTPIKKDIAESYCRDSLCRIGLVAEEVTIDHFGQEKSVGFQLTEAGKIFGLPAAAFVLDFERKNNFSIYQILGQTSLASGDRRAPLTRAKIINFLLERDGVRQIDIAEALGTNHERIRSSIVALKRAGIVDYISLTPQTGRNQVSFSVNQGRIDKPAGAVKKQKQEFSDKVLAAARLLASHGQMVSQKTVFDLLPEAYKTTKEETVRARISKALSNFADRQGLLIRNKFRGREVYSDVGLTDKGGVVARDFLQPLADLLSSKNSDTQRLVRATILPQVLSNLRGYALSTIDLYYPFSRSFSIRNREEIRRTVEFALRESGETGSTSQHLSETLGLGELKTRKVLLKMIDSGISKRELINGVFYYSIK